MWDSDPAAEVEESWVKARPLLAAIAATAGRRVPAARRGRGVTGSIAMKPVAVAVLGRGLVDPDSPVLAADDAGLARGQAAFETLRVYRGRTFALGEHLDRLTASAGRLELPAVDRAAWRSSPPSPSTRPGWRTRRSASTGRAVATASSGRRRSPR